MADKIQDFEVNSPRWLSLEDFEGEVWKRMEGFTHPYEISNMGRVRVLPFTYQRVGKGKTIYSAKRNAHIMLAHDNGHGYLWVNLDGRKSLRRYVHRLVAEYFIPNPNKKTEIDHINTNRGDNRMVNLRWVTKSENMLNPITLQRNKIAQGDPVVLLNCWGEYIGEYFSAQELSEVLGVPSSVVKDAIYKKRKARTVSGFTVVKKKDYDATKDYSIMYKRGTSPYLYVPNAKMVLAFKQGKLSDVFPNIQKAADAYETRENRVSKQCRLSEGNCLFKPPSFTSDNLCYYKDVSYDIQQEALVMFRSKYPPMSFFNS